jgi:NAD-dependent DNA ligase
VLTINNTLQYCKETRRRIRLSLAAFSYEFYDHSLVSDAEFDALAKEIDLSVKTGNRKLDNFFQKHFNPDTGMWIRKHPEKNKLEHLYRLICKNETANK